MVRLSTEMSKAWALAGAPDWPPGTAPVVELCACLGLRLELPVGPAVRQPLQQDDRLQEADMRHLDPAAHQGDKGDLDVERLEPCHVRGAAAGKIGEPHPLDG